MNLQLEAQTRGVIGIYSLYDSKGKCSYVGKADCIFSRLKTHIKNNIPITEVAWSNLTNSVKELRHTEAKWFLRWKENLAILQHNPYLNKTNPFNDLNGVHKFWMAAPEKIKLMMTMTLPSLRIQK